MKVVLFSSDGGTIFRYITGFEKTGDTSRRGPVEETFRLTTSDSLQDAMLFDQHGVMVDLSRMDNLLSEYGGTLIDQVKRYGVKPVKIVPLA